MIHLPPRSSFYRERYGGPQRLKKILLRLSSWILEELGLKTCSVGSYHKSMHFCRKDWRIETRKHLAFHSGLALRYEVSSPGFRIRLVIQRTFRGTLFFCLLFTPNWVKNPSPSGKECRTQCRKECWGEKEELQERFFQRLNRGWNWKGKMDRLGIVWTALFFFF